MIGYERGGYGGYGDRGGAYGDRGSYGGDRGYVDRYGGRPTMAGVGGGGLGYPPYESPQRPPPSGYDNSIGGQGGGGGDGFGGFGPIRPLTSRCSEDSDNFKQLGIRQKVRRQYVRRAIPAQTLLHCQRECVESKDFICRSFNYRDTALSYDLDNKNNGGVGSSVTSREREQTNCELSDRDTRELDLQNPQMFDGGNYDYYERSNSRSSLDNDCLDGKGLI